MVGIDMSGHSNKVNKGNGWDALSFSWGARYVDSGGYAYYTITNTTNFVKPTPKKILYNPPYTTVVWNDDDVTTVKTMEGDEFNEEMGFCACLMRKLYGSRTGYKKMIEEVSHRHLSKEEKKRMKAEKKANKENQG